MQWLRLLLCVVRVDICIWYRQMWWLCLLYLALQEVASLFNIGLPTLGRECYKNPLLPESSFMGYLPFICMYSILLVWLKVSGQKVRRPLPWGIFCITGLFVGSVLSTLDVLCCNHSHIRSTVGDSPCCRGLPCCRWPQPDMLCSLPVTVQRAAH